MAAHLKIPSPVTLLRWPSAAFLTLSKEQSISCSCLSSPGMMFSEWGNWGSVQSVQTYCCLASLRSLRLSFFFMAPLENNSGSSWQFVNGSSCRDATLSTSLLSYRCVTTKDSACWCSSSLLHSEVKSVFCSVTVTTWVPLSLPVVLLFLWLSWARSFQEYFTDGLFCRMDLVFKSAGVWSSSPSLGASVPKRRETGSVLDTAAWTLNRSPSTSIVTVASGYNAVSHGHIE